MGRYAVVGLVVAVLGAGWAAFGHISNEGEQLGDDPTREEKWQFDLGRSSVVCGLLFALGGTLTFLIATGILVWGWLT